MYDPSRSAINACQRQGSRWRMSENEIDKLPSVGKGNPSRCITDGKLTLLIHLAYVILSIMSFA